MMTPKEPLKERRDSPRYSGNLLVRIKNRLLDARLEQGEDCRVEGANLGLGGLSFFSEEPFEPETQLDMTIRVEGWDDDSRRRNLYLAVTSIPYVARGKVVRCEKADGGKKYEVGVKFTEMEDNDQRALCKMLGLGYPD